jgi:Polysaccharide biosynthesis/export protein
MSIAPSIPWRKPRVRHWPTFSLRTLLELVFVCGVVFYIWFNRRPDNIIKPNYVLQIHAAGTLPDEPIEGVYLVDPDGNVNLGAIYGKVNVAGMTGDAAEAVILGHLRTLLSDAQVTVSIAGWRDSWELSRIGELEAEVQRLKQDALSAERRRKGWLDPQNSPTEVADPQR